MFVMPNLLIKIRNRNILTINLIKRKKVCKKYLGIKRGKVGRQKMVVIGNRYRMVIKVLMILIGINNFLTGLIFQDIQSRSTNEKW